MIAFAETAVAGTNAAASPGPPPTPATQEEADRLGEEIAELAAHIHAAEWQLLMLLHAFDAAERMGQGFRSTAHWLSWRTGVGMNAARERVRVARVLPTLPRISEGLRTGRLSFSKVRALTRVATPSNEGDLLEFALHGTASHVERLVRAWRHVDRNEEAARQDAARHERRDVTLYVDTDGSWVLKGRLEPEVGERLRMALEAASDELYPDRAAREGTTPGQRRADAIELVAERALQGKAAASRADRNQLVIHVDAGALEEGATTGAAVLAGSGIGVTTEAARRLACGASAVTVTHGPDHSPAASGARSVLDVGRRRRTVTTPLRRALDVRDAGCRFPGCACRHTTPHHIRHWADGGETALDNLVLLCPLHHRAVHEDGYRVEVADGGALRFFRPDGRELPHAPGMPPAPADPVGALQRKHREAGVAIDGWTPTQRGLGERLDLGWAVRVMWRAREAEVGSRA